MVQIPVKHLSRRGFLKNTGGAGIALWLGFSAKGNTEKLTDISKAENFTPFILVESNGSITIFNSKPEIGQGTFQAVPAMIAEEFEVSLDQVTIKNTNGEKKFGRQSAGGSSSIRTGYTDFRKMGASAKAVFITAAANRWKVEESSCYASEGKIYHQPTKKSLGYGDLVEEAAKIELPKDPRLKDPKDFKIIGKMAHRPDVPLKVNGSAVFGIDVNVPGMLYATVERCPVLGGTLKRYNADEAMKVAGVKKVVAVDRKVGVYTFTGVAVIADSYWNAMKGRKQLKVEWDTKGYDNFNSEDYEAHLRKLADEDGMADKSEGSAFPAGAKTANIVEAFYETPMVAHHALEPMNCIAQVKGDKLDIWTSTQVASSVTGEGDNDLGGQVGFKPENITLHANFVGGGFGRRLYLDFIMEAANIAKQVSQPVKVMWSREDTTQQGPFRPMTFSKLRGVLADDGRLNYFEHKVIAPSLGASSRPNFDESKIDGSMVEGIGEQAYEIPNIRTSFVRAAFHVPVAAWRSVTSSTLSFAHECFIDELAVKAGKDPMAFRLEMLTKQSDPKKVLLKLKEFSNWDKPLPKGKGRGLAQWEFFAGLCGQVVEVTYNADKSIKIDKVYAVIDLGAVVNPDNVKNQVEGAVIMALTAATKPGITFKNGVCEQHNFYDSPLVRINEAPEVETFIIADGGKVKGVGEPGLPPFAPALANAIYNATGKRIRTMPFDLNNIS